MSYQLKPGDFPANPMEKPGYVLEFQDEFDGKVLDNSKWFPYYLPHWSSKNYATPNFLLRDQHLVLQITENQTPWCPEFDGEVKCSSIQTGEYAGPVGSPIGQHRFNPNCRVREAQSPVQTYTPRYGYFEMRARGICSRTNHIALWMIGFEDLPERSGEIAIFEIMGATMGPNSSRVGYGVRQWGDSKLKDEFFEEYFEIDASQFHVYGLAWNRFHLEFFIDNQKIKTIHQSPNYPMQFMLSIYELPKVYVPGKRDGHADIYPKEFEIDYFRAYQRVSE